MSRTYYKIGTTFNYDGVPYVICDIDKSDEEYPYECFPVSRHIDYEALEELMYEDEAEYDEIMNDRRCLSDSEIADLILDEQCNSLEAKLARMTVLAKALFQECVARMGEDEDVRDVFGRCDITDNEIDMLSGNFDNDREGFDED